jgi:hypothetical protein
MVSHGHLQLEAGIQPITRVAPIITPRHLRIAFEHVCKNCIARRVVVVVPQTTLSSPSRRRGSQASVRESRETIRSTTCFGTVTLTRHVAASVAIRGEYATVNERVAAPYL